ncbi:hypothetical protein C1T31_13105 [Hanstruepera neustonica]|uniref:Secretion system C-terminal sorting domain-containing protein n=1 Tax=Hanstruepera neustonica TaxID=1445657 RepID=A0A2K1DW39_9FLAO|nr:T9SS type A sorting domain-containing protein [Hanstruepera neustonica]PNQ72256.1 hypothetical protein C1T31_13105 [Hanstruepera neustonica]
MKSKLLFYFLILPALFIFSYAQDVSFFMTPTCDGAIATITGDTGGRFTFNPTPVDAVTIDPITGSVTNGIPGEIYCVEYSISGSITVSSIVCFMVAYIDIVEPSPLEACTDIGFTEFDLSSKVTEILNGTVDVTLTFHETYSNAVNNINALPLTYINAVANQILYVRGEDLVNGCYRIVELELIAVDCLDSDNDGVIDLEEDVNENGNLEDDDTDMDSIANYLDDDDDGDNVDTIVELSMEGGRTMHNFIDTDGDLIENYLDDDDDGDGLLTIDEDYNNNGDPTDDDTNTNGIPDYLENGVALSVDNLNTSYFTIYPNPVNDILNISTSSQLKNQLSIAIYDIQGKLISDTSYNLETTNFQVDVSNLSTGLYVIKFYNDDIQEIKKLIIN